MMNLLKKVTIPFSGVMLGTAALGNLLQSYSEGVRYICGVVAALILILLVLKMICYPKMIKEELKNPIMASVAGTFSMALMILSTYVKPWIGRAAFFIWIFAILLHITLIIYFTVKFIFHLQMPKVFASYYIVYVGIVTASITAPAYEKQGIGAGAFWFGIAALVILLILVTYRYIKYNQVPEPAKPLICIYAAPTSLCIAGYVQSVTPKSYGFLMGLLIVATVIYAFALVKALGYIKLPFYPSYASFTFPFVISAIASKQAMACFANMERSVPVLQGIVLAETVIATVFVVYTIIRFVMFLFAGEKKQ